jgi:hypothetical protein
MYQTPPPAPQESERAFRAVRIVFWVLLILTIVVCSVGLWLVGMFADLVRQMFILLLL